MSLTQQQILGLLLAQHGALAQRLKAESNLDRAKAIVMEMQEIRHRINLIQSLLFRQSSRQLEVSLAGIRAANGALSRSLQGISNITGFLNAATNFLNSVDRAINIAKGLAA